MEHDVVIINSTGQIGAAEKIRLGPIARALKNPAFKQQLAAAMIAPIRRNLDYQGLARRVLAVDPLPQGALPIYFRDDEDV